MYEFTFTNSNNESLYFAYGTPFVLESVSGLSTVTTYTQTEKSPFQDGASFIDALVNARYLSFMVQIREDLVNNRRKAIRVLNPKLGEGTLKFKVNGVYRYLTCVISETPDMIDGLEGRFPNLQRFTFTVEANDPYWTDDEQTWIMASFIGGFSFPFSFPLSFGTVGSIVLVNNIGDTTSPLFITMNGPLTNPTLTNETTGEYITLIQDLPAGYVLEINTEVGNKSVVIIDDLGNRSNGFSYVSPDSTLFGLNIGENKLSYVADVQPSDVAVTVYFRNRYIGV